MAIDNDFAAAVGKQSVSTGKLMENSQLKYHIKQRLYDVREMIDNHIDQMHTSVTENVKQTIKFMQNVQKTHRKPLKRPLTDSRRIAKLDPSMHAIQRLWDLVASSEEFDERDLVEFKPRIIKGEEEELNALRRTKGEQSDTNFILPKGNLMFINARIDRFKRQSGRQVNTDSSY